MDYSLAVSIQQLTKNGGNTVQAIYSKFGADIIKSAINEGYINQIGGNIFLTQAGMNLTRPVESNIQKFNNNELLCS
jgi:predicted RND superfamily exporter protein